MIARQHTATDPNTALDTLASWLAEAQHIAVLTDAGMSTESGIPDFRSYQGRYTQNASLAEVLSIDYFQHNPAGFWQAARPTGDYSLTGCSVAPGFDFADFSMLSDDSAAVGRLTARFPEMASLV